MFDTVGKSSYGKCKERLTKNGVYRRTVPSAAIMLQALWTDRAKIAFTGLRKPADKAADLRFLTKLVDGGEAVG